MNPNTGELMELRQGEKLPDGFERLEQKRLHTLARLKLERTQAMPHEPARVNLRSQSPLAIWAKKKRKAKIAAASRRRNRK